MRRFAPILFDLDGTLVDSRADIAAAVNRTLAELGLPALEQDEIVGYVGDGVRHLLQRTLSRFGHQDVDAAVAHFKADYRRNCLVQTRAYPGIRRLLERLAGVGLAVVTNKPVEFARQILAGLGLEAHVQAVVGGDETALKPRPEPMRLALERLGATASGGLVVGDHSNDVLAGWAAGLATCGVTWGYDAGASVGSSDPDHICHNLQELETLLFS